MSNPLENKQFRHFLNFKNDDTGRIEISEPVKFDASAFDIEQNGYARDVSFMNEEIDLEFYKGFYEATDTPQTLPSGIIVDRLSHGFDFLIQYYIQFGFESEIEYILQRNNVDFILGVLNLQNPTTDELTYLNCKVVQATKRAILKRREAIKIDVLSDKDLDEATIAPLVPENILLQAKPFIQLSDWSASLPFSAYTGTRQQSAGHLLFQNAISSVGGFGIEDTLSFFDRALVTSPTSKDFFDDVFDFGYIDAKEDLTDVTITFNELLWSYFIGTGEDINFRFPFSTATVQILLFILPIGQDKLTVDDVFATTPLPIYNLPISVTFIGAESISRFDTFDGSADRYDISVGEFSFPVDIIPRDHRLCMIFDMGRDATIVEWLGGRVEIKATSTAIDSVVKGVRYVDLIKQTVLSCNGMSVNAPKFDLGGVFYDQFCFSGNLIRQRIEEPFYATYKDRRETLQEVNADSQVNETDVFVGQYNDFYANVDNGAFLLVPSEEFESTFNERYTINEIEYKYKTFEKDRDEENTLDGVHTEAQFHIPNKQVQNTKKIQVADIRDPFNIESQRRLAIRNTTALTSDNKIFTIDVVPLASGATGTFTASINHQLDTDGNLQLLNSGAFSWALLGFDVGGVFFIIFPVENGHNYEVVEITDSVLTLKPTGGALPTSLGLQVTSVAYPYTNVAWKNRTNEGFDLIENLINPNNFSNLQYTIKRNLKHWESYMATAATFTSGNINNTFFENNRLLKTQFEGGDIIIENAPFPINETDLELPILSPKEYELNVIAEYDDVIALIKKYQVEETIGGFIRVQNTKGAIVRVYPMKLSYVWAAKVLTITGEEKQETQFVIIKSEVGGFISVNEVGYDIDLLPDLFYSITNGYVLLFDINNVNLINSTIFDRIEVNGNRFTVVDDLVAALNAL